MPHFRKAVFLSANVIYALTAYEPALACSDLPNICAAQAQHNKQMIDIAATPQQGREGHAYNAAPPDPMQARMGIATDMIAMMQTQLDNGAGLAELTNDPRYQRYENGGWDFFQDHANAAPGEYCAAFWWKKDGMVRISGPGGDYKGALLTFWSDSADVLE